MRVSLPGIARSGPGFRFRFAGEEIAAWPGETLAAALTIAGHMALSTNGPDERRGSPPERRASPPRAPDRSPIKPLSAPFTHRAGTSEWRLIP